MLAQLDDVVRVGALADGQLVGGDKPLGLVAYVDEYLVAVYADDVALDDVAVLEIYEDALVYGDDLPVFFPKKSFMVSSRDVSCVMSVMKQLLSFNLLDGCRLYSNSDHEHRAISGQLFSWLRPNPTEDSRAPTLRRPWPRPLAGA